MPRRALKSWRFVQGKKGPPFPLSFALLLEVDSAGLYFEMALYSPYAQKEPDELMWMPGSSRHRSGPIIRTKWRNSPSLIIIRPLRSRRLHR